MNGNIGSLPAWFNEGLATYVGGEPDCTGATITSRIDLAQHDNEATWTGWTNTQPNFNSPTAKLEERLRPGLPSTALKGFETYLAPSPRGSRSMPPMDRC